MERLPRDPRLPRWLHLGLDGGPLPPDGPLPGVRVQVQLDLPPGQPLTLMVPILIGPVGRVAHAEVRLTFDAGGRVASVHVQEPSDDDDDSMTSETDSDDDESDNGNDDNGDNKKNDDNDDGNKKNAPVTIKYEVIKVE